MKARLFALLSDDFVRHNVVFFVGSMTVAVLNYLYHPIVSRMLSIEDFGEVQVLFSLLAQIGIPLGIFHMVALNLYTNKHAPDSPSIRHTSLLTMYVAGFSALGILLATPHLIHAFKLSSPWGLAIVSLTLIITALTTFGRASLQAHHRFTETSIANAIGAGGKLIAAVALILLGLTVMGAMAGFFIASLATLLYVWRKAHTHMALPHLAAPRLTPELTRELKYGLLVLFGTGVTTFFSTADITIVKYLFPADVAGLYSGMSIIARILYFATGSVGGVLLAHLVLTAAPAENARVLKKGLLLTALIAGSGLLIMMTVPKLVIGIMMGSTYLRYADLLPPLALHTFMLSLVGVFVSYALALRKNSVIIVGMVGVGSTLGFLLFAHGEPSDVVNAFLFGSIITLATCAITYLRK